MGEQELVAQAAYFVVDLPLSTSSTIFFCQNKPRQKRDDAIISYFV